MIKQLNTLLLIAIMILLSSCEDKEDKEAKKLKKEQLIEEQRKENTVRLNKDFNYHCLIISSKTKISLDTVKKVLKEYFIHNKEMSFYPNSFSIYDDGNWKQKEKHNLDLINETSTKYSIPFKDVVTIYSELLTLERIDDLEFAIDELYYTIQDLESELNTSN